MSHKIDFKSKRKTKVVNDKALMEELGEPITLLALSSKQLTSLDESDVHRLPKLLALSIVDENLQPIYTTAEDVDNLSEMSVSVQGILGEAMKVLNGFGKEVIEEQTKKYLQALDTDSATV